MRGVVYWRLQESKQLIVTLWVEFLTFSYENHQFLLRSLYQSQASKLLKDPS